MTITIANNNPRIAYTATASQTAFTVPFEFFDASDLNVFINETLKTITTHYTVSGGNGSTGTVTLTSGATVNDKVLITRDVTLERTTDFPTSGPFQVASLNTELDKIIAMMADLNDLAGRGIQLADSDTAVSVTLPNVTGRAGKVLAFNASTGAVEAGPTITATQTVAEISADISTVAGISSNVTSVAGIASNVTTVAGIAANVTTVAGKASLITSDFVSDLNTLATSAIIEDLGILATADIVSDINTLATSDIVSDLNTLATSDIVSDINTLATSDIVSDLNALATSDFISDLNTIATSANITNISTVATNIAGVTSFAERYRVGSSDPSSSLDEGDLAFNTTDNNLKFYNGSAWVAISPGIANVVEDTTPQLGGTLDVNGNTIDMNGNELILDVDADTSITADTDDQIDFKVGGSDKASLTSTGLNVDTIGEKTADAGVTVDGTNVKDNAIKPTDSSGTNAAGTALTLKGGAGTGSGTGGSIILQTADGGSSGSSVNSHATRVTILDDGNVGINEPAPSVPLEVKGAQAFGSSASNLSTSTTKAAVRIRGSSDSSTSLFFGSITNDAEQYIQSANGAGSAADDIILNPFGGNVMVGQGSSERTRVDTSGRLLIGITAPTTTGAYFEPSSLDRTVLFLGSSNATSGITLLVFSNPNGIVGGVSTNASSTSYNTSSDYRLKENVADLTGAIDRVKTLAPKRFNFIADPDTTVDGFLAHEVTAVPEAITGTKDATEAIGDVKDADGNIVESKVVKPQTLEDGHTWTETGTRPVYQGIDQSKLVPVLTAALQEAIAKIETLETKVAALEG